jgi:hypothetical protein
VELKTGGRKTRGPVPLRVRRKQSLVVCFMIMYVQYVAMEEANITDISHADLLSCTNYYAAQAPLPTPIL